MRIGILCEWVKIKLDGIEWNEWEGNEWWEGEKGKENVSVESVREERKNLEEFFLIFFLLYVFILFLIKIFIYYIVNVFVYIEYICIVMSRWEDYNEDFCWL